jgi:hypothetical protein
MTGKLDATGMIVGPRSGMPFGSMIVSMGLHAYKQAIMHGYSRKLRSQHLTDAGSIEVVSKPCSPLSAGVYKGVFLRKK